MYVFVSDEVYSFLSFGVDFSEQGSEIRNLIDV